MTPFEILMLLWTTYNAMHGALAGGKLSGIKGTVYLVAKATPADAASGEIPIVQWTQ